ncbi:MAG TPA: haloacid dehalogenase-like hydrolase [Luteibacter sp.]|uniref:haloacid dehalogenase-like hydrolase n=1 Tax=Luteibacter sp. TaxID=1886636 RepID=UPI002C7B9538|nr:haloacid dehalogenase-like hydrolase [Luteibacter sp.]HVI56085.1 haloacid dehalogenase-like hydrolase [Luteibacter sp.]
MFDLDRTLLSADSTVAWMRCLLRASPWKLLAVLPVLPVALVLLRFPSARRMGASVLLWIVTYGLDRSALGQSIEAFATRFERGMPGLRWFDDGMERLRVHLAGGDRVVVVTAAPQWIAERLLAVFGSDLQVIGSVLRRAGSGWILQRHCHGAEKSRMLLESGYGGAWRWAYSDSDDDAPMLLRAREAFLVNANAKVQRRAAARGVSQAVLLRWR